MEPNLKQSTTVITFNWYYFLRSPHVNDLVVAKVMERLVIKRIKKTKKNEVWLEGDNKEASTDSRSFGWIDKKDIMGKVVYIF